MACALSNSNCLLTEKMLNLRQKMSQRPAECPISPPSPRASRDSRAVDSGAGDRGAQGLRLMVFIVLTFTKLLIRTQGKICASFAGEAENLSFRFARRPRHNSGSILRTRITWAACWLSGRSSRLSEWHNGRAKLLRTRRML